jgi:hypothetical protein
MRATTILVLGLVCVSTFCFSQPTWDKYRIDRRLIELKGANLKRYTDSVDSKIRNYSVSKIVKKFVGHDSLKYCQCKISADTLRIKGFEFNEGGVTYQIEVKGNKYSTSTIFYSDIQEYGPNSDKYELEINSVSQYLALSKKNIKTGDKVLGQLKIRSRPMEHVKTNPTIEFQGTFQCIVE